MGEIWMIGVDPEHHRRGIARALTEYAFEWFRSEGMTTAMVETGVSPMAAHMFVLYYGMLSFITPPVCIGAFFAAKLAESDQMRTGFVAMRFGWSAFVVPVLFIFAPSLLLDGEPLDLLHDIGTAIAGVWLVSIAIVGYFRRSLSAVQRAAFTLAGALLLFPSGAADWGFWTDVAGVIIGGIIVSREFMVPKQQTSLAV